jgi:hypothetical protein
MRPGSSIRLLFSPVDPRPIIEVVKPSAALALGRSIPVLYPVARVAHDNFYTIDEGKKRSSKGKL